MSRRFSFPHATLTGKNGRGNRGGSRLRVPGSGLRLAGVAVEGAFGNLEGGADVGDGVVGVGFHRSGQGDLVGGERAFAPSPAAPGARGFETRPGALADQVALELGQGGEDVEDQLAAGRRGVDMLLQALEADAARVRARGRFRSGA